METQILTQDLSLAIETLRKGSPVVFPTETVYGLGAPLFNEEAVRKIFILKGRPLDNPLIAHIASLEEAFLLSDKLDPLFDALAKTFWPGPLAIVVKRRQEVPDIVSAGQPTIAIRMPSHAIARQLIAGVGEPLVAPSANLSGRPSPTCLRDVLEDFDGRIECVIDGGECEIGIESTVISLFHAVPTILRPGVITKEMLETALHRPVALAASTDPILSPGMKYRHYAPKTPVRLIYQREDLTDAFLLPTAKTLYRQLREADRLGLKNIEIYCDPSVQSDRALMNRLLRAAGQVEK